MKSLFSALRFLTVLPIGKEDGPPPPWAMAFFPVVGALLGLLLAGADRLLTAARFDPFAAAALVVVLSVGLTGGLHADGWADSADALFSGKGRAEMLEIMRDPRVGTWGALSLTCLLLVKTALLASIPDVHKAAALVVMTLSGRWSLVMGTFFFPYARAEGKAKTFASGITRGIFLTATIAALAGAALLGGPRGIALFGTAGVSAVLLARWIRGRIGGMTGDTLGALNEWTETAVLAAACVAAKAGAWQ